MHHSPGSGVVGCASGDVAGADGVSSVPPVATGGGGTVGVVGVAVGEVAGRVGDAVGVTTVGVLLAAGAWDGAGWVGVGVRLGSAVRVGSGVRVATGTTTRGASTGPGAGRTKR